MSEPHIEELNDKNSVCMYVRMYTCMYECTYVCIISTIDTISMYLRTYNASVHKFSLCN